VNIVLFHAFMAPSGLPLAAVVVILWGLTAWSVRSALAGIFAAKV
jgi:putative oxidoreductase